MGGNMRDRFVNGVRAALFVAGILILTCPGLHAQQTMQPGLTVNQVVDRVIAREQNLIKQLATFHPYVETYIQNLGPDSELGTVPTSDRYFLSRVDFKNGVHTQSMLESTGVGKIRGQVEYLPDGFAAMIFVDQFGFNRQNYTFEFVRRDYLGSIRCLVFEVTPIKAVPGRFTGQIWIEDQDYSIVRFSGIHGPAPKLNASQLYFHCDSWRQNAGPNLWLPSYVYTEESVDPKMNFK